MTLSPTLAEPTTRPRPLTLLPGHPGYDEARLAWNLAADQRPAAIVVARSAQDVIDAVDLADRLGLQIVPQGTGHLASAVPAMERALLVKTAIGGVEVDPVQRRARVGAGAIWQDVVDAVTPHGLAALSGSSFDVGVVGYTLGGGASWLARAKGLAANNVHAIEVVTAWAAWAKTAPDAVTTSLRLLRLPPLPEIPEPMRDTPVVVVDGAVLADAPEAEAILRDFRSVGTPVLDTWATMSPAGLLEIHMDPPQPVPALGDTALLHDLDAAAIDALLDVVEPEEVAPLLFAEIRQLGGALGRIPEGAGARGCFEGAFLLFGVGVPMSPEHAAALDARLTQMLDALRPWSTGTRYLNFAERGGEASDAYGDGVYERLQAARRTWDPGERFVGSHRIATR